MVRFLIAVEDALSEAVVRQMMHELGFAVEACYGKSGFGYLKRNIQKFQAASYRMPYFVLTDLDQYVCATALKQAWGLAETPPNFLFRIAVRAIESWVLADRERIADFLGIALKHIPLKPDQEPNPKQRLIELARRGRNYEVRADLVPKPHSTARVGRNYNARLGWFVTHQWQLQSAQVHSDSLARAVRALERFRLALT